MDRIVATLDEDIWALAYVVVRNRGSMPCSLCILLCIVYAVQAIPLSVMVWSYSVMLNHDVESEYEFFGDCGLTFKDDTNITLNQTLFDDYDISTTMIMRTL